MDTKKVVLLSLMITITLKVFGQSQPDKNPLVTPNNYTPPVPTQTNTATPITPYTNHVPGSSAPYTEAPLPQQTAPPPAANPPPAIPPHPMTAPTITEPTQPPIPPPPPK